MILGAPERVEAYGRVALGERGEIDLTSGERRRPLAALLGPYVHRSVEASLWTDGFVPEAEGRFRVHAWGLPKRQDRPAIVKVSRPGLEMAILEGREIHLEASPTLQESDEDVVTLHGLFLEADAQKDIHGAHFSEPRHPFSFMSVATYAEALFSRARSEQECVEFTVLHRGVGRCRASSVKNADGDGGKQMRFGGLRLSEALGKLGLFPEHEGHPCMRATTLVMRRVGARS